MTDFVSPVLQWLNDHPNLAGLVTFTISAAESVAIIGTIVPGSIMMTALGTLAGAGIIPLWETLFWATVGAVVGDGISYWVGHHFKGSLARMWPFNRYPNLLISGEKFVHKYGGMSVFIGRFVGPVRALVPLAAGMLGMKPLKFIIANVTSAIGWAPAYMLPGIMLGAASLELPPDIATHVILVLLLIFLFILLCLWFVYKLLQLIHNQINEFQNWVWNGLKRSRYFSPITVLLKHNEIYKEHGQLSLALVFITTSSLFALLAYYVTSHGASNIHINNAAFHLFRGIRTERAEDWMLNITLLGQKQVIVPVAMVITALLLYWRRFRVAAHAAALIVMTSGSVYLFKHYLQSVRPWGIFQSPETFSMPSGHATLSAALFMGYAFLIAQAFKPNKHKLIYFIGIIIVLFIGISRLYLGAHWFTDIISAWLLAASILTLVIISYQRKDEKPINPYLMTLVMLISFAVSFSIYHYKNFTQLKTNYELVNWPTANITMQEWWQKNSAIPAYHTSLFGFPSEQINIEWVGDFEQIREALIKEGWGKPPMRDFISTLHRIADVESAQYLPLISPQYLDKKPAITLTRSTNNGEKLLVIRLWDANRTIKETGQTVWVGIIAVVPRTYSWLFEKRPTNLLIEPTLVFPKKKNIMGWEWKVMTMKLTVGSHKPIQQKIIMIKKSSKSAEKSATHHSSSHKKK